MERRNIQWYELKRAFKIQSWGNEHSGLLKLMQLLNYKKTQVPEKRKEQKTFHVR